MIQKIRALLILTMAFSVVEIKAQTICEVFLGAEIPLGVSINGRTVMMNDGTSSWSFDAGPFTELSKKLSSIHLISGALSPDKQTVAVQIRGSANDYISTLIVLFSKEGKMLTTLKLNRGTDVFWPANNPNVLIVPFNETHYISDWYMDTSREREKVTVGSDLIDWATGDLKGTVIHGLGWDRFKALAWPSEKYYVPSYKIFWSKTGNFYADIDGDRINIYEVNPTSLATELVKSVSLKALKEKFKNTLGLFASDLTKFERELAESLKLTTN